MLPNFRSRIEMLTFAAMVDTNTSSPSTDKDTRDASNHDNAPSPIQTPNSPNSSLNNWEITPADPPNTTQHLNTGSSQENAYNNPIRGLHLLYKAAMLHDPGSDKAQGSSDTNKVKAQKIVRKTKPAKKTKRLPLNSPVSNPNKTTQSQTKNPKTYLCNFINTVTNQICRRQFPYPSLLKRHKRCHTGEKPYKCNTCDKRFSQNCTLINHSRSIHTEDNYTCDICNKTLTDKSNFIKHIRIHTGEKPYKCNICDKSFTQNSALIKHSRIHTGEKPYKCNICNKSFTQNGALIKHSRIHTREKPYKGNTCDICDKMITDKSNFIKHMRIHTGERPYKCNICNKSFTRSDTLFNHSRIHTRITIPATSATSATK